MSVNFTFIIIKIVLILKTPIKKVTLKTSSLNVKAFTFKSISIKIKSAGFINIFFYVCFTKDAKRAVLYLNCFRFVFIG